MSELATKLENCKRTFSLKLCTLGDGGVGKSTLVERIATGIFNSNTKITIGIDIKSIHLEMETEEEKILIEIAVWDLGGEKQFRFILPSYICGADGALLLFDVNRFRTMENLKEWVDLWRKNTLPGTPLYLIGAQYDRLIPNYKTRVQTEIREMSKVFSADKYFLTSSKTGEQIQEVISNIVKDMLWFKKINLVRKTENLLTCRK